MVKILKMIETQQEKIDRIHDMGLISENENNYFNELIQEKLKKSIKEKKKLLNLKDMGIIKTKTLSAEDVGNILNNVNKSYGLNNKEQNILTELKVGLNLLIEEF